ncbi:MAG: phosphatase PAP2 family protein [Ferrovibrio sp.]|uniref:phosphatase PAP2 family protein n=1 Tax=Ferrovibrio sp. TaxID=1917215 RepID=UPI00391CE0AD
MSGRPDAKRGLAARPLRLYAVEVAMVGMVAALLIRYVDLPLALRLSGVQAGAAELGALLKAIHYLGRGEYYMAVALPALLLGGWLVRQGSRAMQGWSLLRAGVLVAGTLALGHLLVFLLKQVFARLRPSELARGGGYGFADPFSGEPFTSLPSSHAFTAFAMAAVFSRLQPELRAVFFGAALLVAVQRMLTQHHFLSDIFVSLFLALMVSEAVHAAWHRFGRPILARRLSY